MKKLMMICALVFSVITYASAQKMQRTPEEMAKRMVDRLTEKLKLTADQQTKATMIFVEQGNAMAKIREEAGEDRGAVREKSMKLRKENDAKFNAILTDDQKAAYKTMQEEQKAKMQNRGGNMKTATEKPSENM